MGLVKRILMSAFILSTLTTLSLFAQEQTESSFYFGIGGGYHSSSLNISKLDKETFPDNSRQGSGIFNIFVQYEFGNKKQFGIRLEADFLKRGGNLDNIANTSIYNNLYEAEGIHNIGYSLRSNYVDFRLPIIYQFGNSRSVIRPYIYVAPYIALSTGGYIKSTTEMENNQFYGTSLDITKGNMKSSQIGGMVGLGLKYDLNLCGHPFYLTFEANYQMGLTNTYSSKEMNGSAIVVNNQYFYAYDIKGNRKFNGFEVKGSLNIPFSVFTKKKAVISNPSSVIYTIEEDTTEVVAAPVINPIVMDEDREIPCFTIEEINQFIINGQDIRGVTFCSIDDIRFETNSSTLDSSSFLYLDQVANILQRTGVNIEVKGHTDNTGSAAYNMDLSRDRAMSVVNYLEGKGIKKSQLSFSYYGSTLPIASNDTEEGRSINRRVEFEIK